MHACAHNILVKNEFFLTSNLGCSLPSSNKGSRSWGGAGKYGWAWLRIQGEGLEYKGEGLEIQGGNTRGRSWKYKGDRLREKIGKHLN